VKLLIFIVLTFSAISSHANTFNCGGTEPFWDATINIDTGLVKIKDPTNLNGIKIQTTIIPALGTTPYFAFIAKGKDVLLAVVGNETCSDGMSETKYTHSIMMIGYNKEPFTGCCKQK
jgi:uncharacterized membrane protein